MVTNPAMITIYAAIRIWEGMKFRRAEISTLEQMRMTVTANPIPRPLKRLVVMARVEHMPKSCTVTGFLVKRPSFT